MADTHTVIWLPTEREQLSRPALQAIESALADESGIVVSAISLVEMTYLIEKGRIPPESVPMLLAAQVDPATALRVGALDIGIALAVERIPRDIVADMPDRDIAATALSLGLPLVTRDAAIRRLGIETIW